MLIVFASNVRNNYERPTEPKTQKINGKKT